MESYLNLSHLDLTTPDGKIKQIEHISEEKTNAKILIEHISPKFIGYKLPKDLLIFNLKSSLGQLGIHSKTLDVQLNVQNFSAEIFIELQAKGRVASALLPLLEVGCFVGKIFAMDDRRLVRDPFYLSRMFSRQDFHGDPLLSLGGGHGSEELILEKVDGRTIAHLAVLNGIVSYKESIYGFLPTICAALKNDSLSIRGLLSLHQQWIEKGNKTCQENDILLVKTPPLHVRTVFGKVVNDYLPKGAIHTSASILQPDTKASGDIYELFGSTSEEIYYIPLEFYTLEPHREHVFFEDRDQLKDALDVPNTLFSAFKTIGKSNNFQASVFVVKGEQLLSLKEEDWIYRECKKTHLPGVAFENRQAAVLDRFIKTQSIFPFLEGIEKEDITSQGALLTRYFPSYFIKRALLSPRVQRLLKRIYFHKPSYSKGEFFTQNDRSLLNDLATFAISVYWVDEHSGKVLKYLQRKEADAGMFVPLDQVDTFMNATTFGIYGSNLLEGEFEKELQKLLNGVLEIKQDCSHFLLNKETPLALVTGGGPGAMAVGNRVAKNLGILSCANIVDFSKENESVNEQAVNPHIDAKMTFNLNRLIERQAEFHLEFPIFVQGGIGTDFEFCLEEVGRKVGAYNPTPMLLFGKEEYWEDKITSRFKCNLEKGTIKGSEWVSNCFYCVGKAEQGLHIYRSFFDGKLPIGPGFPHFEKGFATADSIEN
jgi:predicted Rossmann-fold nucleotide-binding protein